MREHALHADAGLAGVPERATRQARQCHVEIGVVRDDHRRDAAVLERAARAWRELGTQRPADCGRADEAEEADARVGNQLGRQLVILWQHHLRPVGRQAGLVEDLDHRLAAQRRRQRGLDDHRRTDRDRRCDLVHDQVERVIERTHTDDDPDRLVLRERHTPC